MDMDLSSALSICRQVLNHYRAFKDLNEVIEGAVLAEQLTKELTVQIGQLTEQKAALQKEKDAAEEQVAKAEQEGKEILAEAQKSVVAAQAKLKTYLEDMDTTIKEKQAQIDGLDQELEAGRARIGKELAALQEEADREEARLQTAREALAALKDKL